MLDVREIVRVHRMNVRLSILAKHDVFANDFMVFLVDQSHQMSKYMKWNTEKYSEKVVASRRVLAMYGCYVFSVLSYTQAGLLAKIAINKVDVSNGKEVLRLVKDEMSEDFPILN